MNNTPLIFITYDSITNSVFEGQVLEPLRKRKQSDPSRRYVLVSFERDIKQISKSNALTLSKNICDEVHIMHRFPYFGIASLYHSVHAVRKILQQHPSYEIIARGPLAGWIALRAIDSTCTHITVQARGLCAEEYAYTHKKSIWYTRWWHAWRYQSLKNIEHEVYGKKRGSFAIETVSSALQEYLITSFKTPKNFFIDAAFDVPLSIAAEQKNIWRKQIRTSLGIADAAKVYCYNGSMKSWQCPELVMQYVEQELRQNPDSFFLLLTQDTHVFAQYVRKRNCNPAQYKILHVPHHDIYRYLCAADKGIIFRQPSVINWVSRPTKVLEYRAVQIPVIHNNTIGFLHQDDQHDYSGNSFYECR